jgi:hypothetical protein
MTAADKIQTKDLKATGARVETRVSDHKEVARDQDHRVAARAETRVDRATVRRDRGHRVVVHRDQETRAAKAETRVATREEIRVADNNALQDKAITGHKAHDARRAVRAHATRGRVHRNHRVHRKRIKIDFL